MRKQVNRVELRNWLNRGKHARLIYAGWAYRVNPDKGGFMYRDPDTGLWHAVADAIRILDGPAAA